MTPIAAQGGALPLAQPHRVLELGSAPVPAVGPDDAAAFSTLFVEAVASANTQGHQAKAAAAALADGRSDDVHGVMIEMSKAGIETRFVTNIRNKVVDAFYEIWRMSI